MLLQVRGTQPVEARQYHRIAEVVVGDEERLRVGLQQVVARLVADLEHDRAAVLVQARQQPAAMAPGGGAVGRAFLDAGQRAHHAPDCREGKLASGDGGTAECAARARRGSKMPAGSAVPVPASHLDVARDAEPATKAVNAAMAAKLPFDDVAAFEAARRGLIAPVPEGVVRAANGTVVWNLGEYAFIDGELAPATVNPSLWRMARLNLANGLFKVTDRLYQLRGFDISNLTVIEGDTGVILIDPLTTSEVARAALELYYGHRPRKPVVAVIYTHSHIDHFGGVRGVIDEADVKAGKGRIIAPGGLLGGGARRNPVARGPPAPPPPVPCRPHRPPRPPRHVPARPG